MKGIDRVKQQAVLLVLFLMWTTLSSISQHDSSKTDAIKTKRNDVHLERRTDFPDLDERLVVLLIGSIAVGGLALLLNERRKKVDRSLESEKRSNQS